MILASSPAPTFPPSSASSPSSLSSSPAISYPTIPSPPPSHSRVEDFGLSRPKPSCGSHPPPIVLFAPHDSISLRSTFSLPLFLSYIELRALVRLAPPLSPFRAKSKAIRMATGRRTVYTRKRKTFSFCPSVCPFTFRVWENLIDRVPLCAWTTRFLASSPTFFVLFLQHRSMSASPLSAGHASLFIRRSNRALKLHARENRVEKTDRTPEKCSQTLAIEARTDGPSGEGLYEITQKATRSN